MGARLATTQPLDLADDDSLLMLVCVCQQPVLATVLVQPRSVIVLAAHVVNTPAEPVALTWAHALIRSGVPGFYALAA